MAAIVPRTGLWGAELVKNELRVAVPGGLMTSIQKADTPDTARAECIQIAREMLTAASPMIQGVQVSAPFGRYACAVEILEVVLSDAKL